jgi:hypothetical protein
MTNAKQGSQKPSFGSRWMVLAGGPIAPRMFPDPRDGEQTILDGNRRLELEAEKGLR